MKSFSYSKAKKFAIQEELGKKARSLREVKKQSQISDLKSQGPKAKEPWEIEEALPTGEEIFKREKNPWVDEDEE